MRKCVIHFFTLLIILCGAGAKADDFDFDCAGAEYMVSILEEGPDFTVEVVVDDPNGFALETMDGWKCTTIPMPPLKNGRVFLEGLSCFRSNDETLLSDADFAAAGEVYKRNLKNVLACFGDQAYDSTPASFSNTSRGEQIQVALKQFVEDGRGDKYYLIVIYGYYQDRKSPIIWETGVKIGSKYAEQN